MPRRCLFCCTSLFVRRWFPNIGIKHGFSCINIRQVPWEVLKTEAETFATFCVISCTILFRPFTDVSRMKFPRTMLVLGPERTYLVRSRALTARELLIHCLSPVYARVLIKCGTAFYAIIIVDDYASLFKCTTAVRGLRQ